MKIIYITQPVWMLEDWISNPKTGDMERIQSTHATVAIKSTKITEHDDGLDEWLISVKNQGHDEIYLFKIEKCPIMYDPINFDRVQYSIIRYFSRKNPKLNETNRN